MDEWKLPRRCPPASTTVTEICDLKSGNHLYTSFVTKSWSSPANSTDVGPPPTITKVSSFLASSSVQDGLLALSKHSISLLRIARECSNYFRKNTWGLFSMPETPNVFVSLPGASTSLSYFRLNEWSGVKKSEQ